MRKAIRIYTMMATTLLPLCLLTGCISLFPGKELPKYHDLTITESIEPIHSDKTLVVERPKTSQILNSKNIIVRKSLSTDETYLTFIKGHQWSEELPKLFQKTLVHSLRSPTWVNVFRQEAVGTADYNLEIEILEFNVIDPDQITLSVYLTLVNNKLKRVKAAKEFHTKMSVPAHVSGFMHGFDQACSELLIEVQQWLKANL